MLELIQKLETEQPLSPEEVSRAAEILLDESVPERVRTDFLRALAEKGESPKEIAGFVTAFLQHARVPPLDRTKIDGPLIDVCGTGGDKLSLFNVSTTAMFLVAAAGATVVKHGNRGITSPSGGADVLAVLGVPAELPPDRFGHCVERAGVGFMFAPTYHPAFKAVAPLRRQLASEGRRTIFNLIGPLLNPLQPDHQLIGVFDESLVPVFADILARLGRRRAWVAHGSSPAGGMDEMSTAGPTLVATVEDARTKGDAIWIEATDYQIPKADLGALRGGDAEQNAAILLAILEGRERGAMRDLVVWNAAGAICAAGLADHLDDALQQAVRVLDSGQAHARLRDLQNACRD